jgi:hypothetical protein
MSDFIKRAAMRFGVGLDLWSKEDLQSPRLPASAASGRDTPTGTPDPTSVTINVPPADSAPDGADAGSDPVVGEKVGSGPATLEGTDELASDEQWHNLLAVVDGSKVRAANRINKHNGTAYTYASAREGATWQELVKAMQP